MLNLSWRCLLAVFCFPALMAMLSGSAHAREIVDMSGRNVSVPDTITKVYGASPPVTCMIYAMDPGIIAGFNSPTTREEGRLISAEVKNLPVIGGWFGQGISAGWLPDPITACCCRFAYLSAPCFC